MIHRLFTTCSCVGTSIQLSVYPNFPKSVRRDGARRTCRTSGAKGVKRAGACGCKTSALIPVLPPSSSAFGVNSLPNASSCKQAVHRSLGRNRSIVPAFTTPLAVPTSTVFDPSIDPKSLPCSERESTGPRGRADGCRDIHHTRSPNCPKG